MTDLQPTSDRVLVRVDAPEEVVNGIVLPQIAQQAPQRGVVLATGNGRRLDSGQLVPCNVEVGDVVVFTRYGGTEITFDGEELVLLTRDDVLARVLREGQDNDE